MAPVTTSSRPATCHPDQPERAAGLCAVCYRAKNKADRLAKKLAETRNDAGENKMAAALAVEWDRDPALKAEFGKIMWGWVRGAAVEEIYRTKDGVKERDYLTEAKLGELAQKRADKAATVLGRAYVTEKVEEVKPQPLPIGASVDTSGWGGGPDDAEPAEINDDEETLEDGDTDDEE